MRNCTAMAISPGVGKPSMRRWYPRRASTSAGKTGRLCSKVSSRTGATPGAGEKMDATHTKKHGKSYFGYKLSVSVDLKHGFIRRICTGTASEHDGHHFDEVLDLHNTGRCVHTDKAYASRQRQQLLKVLGMVDAMQRPAGQAPERVPAKAQSAHRKEACQGGACVCRSPSPGRQIRSHDRASAGHGGNDDDGRLLQPQAPGVVPASASGCILQTRKRHLQGTGAPAHSESMSRWGRKGP